MKGNLVKNLARSVVLLLAAPCGSDDLPAHEVTWWGNFNGANPTQPMVLFFGRDWCGDKSYGYINIKPASGEPCVVQVNITSVSSSAISYRFEDGINEARSVWIEVDVEGLGPGAVNATISGEWHATGYDENGTADPTQCDALSPQPFTVPVVVTNRPRLMLIRSLDFRTIQIVPGDVGGGLWSLQRASSLTRPRWKTVGVGSTFTFDTSWGAQFFKVDNKTGSPVTGTITDPSGNPQSGVTIGLAHGGLSATTGLTGSFSFSWAPRGLNLYTMYKDLTYVDPGTGSNRTQTASVNFVVPVSTNDAAVAVKMDAAVNAGPGTNGCDCTPWCAIATGTLNGAQRPVYFSGGAYPPKSGPADCDPPQVTVTPPGGAPYSIKAGTDLEQNSGRHPASGTWTVTTTVCGRSISRSVTVP